MQQILSSFATSLKTSLMLMPNHTLRQKFASKDMQNIRGKVQGAMDRIRERLQTEMVVLHEVNRYVGQTGQDFRKLIDLVTFILLRPNLKAKEVHPI
jgi:hypothetical protein